MEKMNIQIDAKGKQCQFIAMIADKIRLRYKGSNFTLA